MNSLFVYLFLYLLLYVSETTANKSKDTNPMRNKKKQDHQISKTGKSSTNMSENSTKNQTANATEATRPFKRWKYKDYRRKFDATTIYERTERKYKRRGINVSRDKIYEEVMNRIDPTDELLKFTPDKGDWRVLFGPQYRKTYLPPGTFLALVKDKVPGKYFPRADSPAFDPYGLRPRIYELMKQVIYQSRDKMTIMQQMREEHNHSALFRMGFLMAKADQAIKDYHSITFKTQYACSALRMHADYITISILEVLSGYERGIMHWFEAELLWDLINRNDRICKQIIARYHTDRKEEFNKQFVN